MTDQPIRMYGSSWCPDCKRAKQFFYEHQIPFEWIELEGNEEARQYVRQINQGKQIIPTILFPDGSILVEPTNAQLAEKLGTQRQAKKHYYDLLIIGGGPAGLTAAIYAGREGIDALLIERSGIGGNASVIHEIENYPGFPEPISGAELADRLRRQAERFQIEMLQAQAVTSINRTDQHVGVKVKTGDEYFAPAVILALGAARRRLEVPGEEQFIGAGVHFCATCDGPFYKGKNVAVVGGGSGAFEEALFLSKFVNSVTILEASKQLKASQTLKDKVISRPNVQILTETTVQEFRGNTKLQSIVAKNTTTGETKETPIDAVFVFIGLRPNTEFLKGVIDLDERGFIITKPNLETSIPGVFAAGDCRAGSTKQVAGAVGEGATVALMTREYLERVGEKGRTREERVPVT